MCESTSVNMQANLENSAVAIGLEKVRFCSNPKERPKNVQTAIQLCSFHMLARSCSKSFKLDLMVHELKTSDIQARFRKGRGTRDQIANIHWSTEKNKGIFLKKSTFASLTMLKPFTMWITANCGKFFKRWEYQTTLPASWETYIQDKKQQNWT